MKTLSTKNDHILVVRCEKMKKNTHTCMACSNGGTTFYGLGTFNLQKCGGKINTEGRSSRFAFFGTLSYEYATLIRANPLATQNAYLKRPCFAKNQNGENNIYR